MVMSGLLPIRTRKNFPGINHGKKYSTILFAKGTEFIGNNKSKVSTQSK